ncbi:MAG: hypothetical protein CFE43_00270 [Burkholderiales bacterium PBB3]|nr:MAG: hypothetical protein CFE43_00270 [Burkholderiales bacterium PBB3]
MPLYSWRCLACDIANPAAQNHCARCGCRPNPNRQQIAVARASAGIVEPVDGPTFEELIREVWNYARDTPGKKNAVAKLLFEIAVLVFGALVVAVALKAFEFFN